MIGVKCSFCNKELKKGEFITTIGKVGGFSKVAFRVFGQSNPLALFDEPKLFCQSCFNKQFKKK